MKIKTEEEIINKVKEIWKEEDRYNSIDINVKIEKEHVEIHISRMYDAPGLSFAKLSAISDFFETKNIDEESFNHAGCETCDYGSSYGFVIIIKPENK